MLTEADIELFLLAKQVGTKSVDRSRKVGVVIANRNREVVAVGFNAFPRGTRDVEARHVRPAKYLWTEHAERNAIYDAARRGVGLDGCTMYLPWFPCMDCARAIVQSGIERLVALRPDLADRRWGEHFGAAIQLFRECGVGVDWVEDREALFSNSSPSSE
jgi:dCMP deaminase